MSDAGIGGILELHVDDKWLPLAFTSQLLFAVETRYSVFDCELLAAYYAICHFHSAFEGHYFTLFMYHCP